MNELQTFLLEGRGIRGALVRLGETWRQIAAAHAYAPDLERLLGESVAASVLLASGLKSKTKVSLQLQGDGPVKLLLVQCSETLGVRAMAQSRAAAAGEPLLGGGRLVVNLDTGGPQGLFQGIVPLESARLEACLEAYFAQSEQLPTSLVLKSAQHRVAGLLLQALPGHDLEERDFERAAALARAVSAGELIGLPARELLPGLFERYEIRLFRARPVSRDCRCTPERLAGVVRMLGAREIEELLADLGCVELTCEFCNRVFRYGDTDVAAIMSGEARSSRLH